MLLILLVLVLVPPVGIAGVGIALVADHALVLVLTTSRLWRRHRMATLKGLRSFVSAGMALSAVGAAVPSPPGNDLVLAGKIAALVVIVLGVVLCRTLGGVHRSLQRVGQSDRLR